MIVVCRRKKTELLIFGHACSAPRGEDLVCAAVSALALTLAEHAEKFPGSRIRMLPGDTRISCPATDGAAQIFDCIFAGFQLLARMFPDYISEAQCPGQDKNGFS